MNTHTHAQPHTHTNTQPHTHTNTNTHARTNNPKSRDPPCWLMNQPTNHPGMMIFIVIGTEAADQRERNNEIHKQVN